MTRQRRLAAIQIGANGRSPRFLLLEYRNYYSAPHCRPDHRRALCAQIADLDVSHRKDSNSVGVSRITRFVDEFHRFARGAHGDLELPRWALLIVVRDADDCERHFAQSSSGLSHDRDDATYNVQFAVVSDFLWDGRIVREDFNAAIR